MLNGRHRLIFKAMRKIDTLIIHCSATKCGADFSAADIDRWHRQRGFRKIGYHYVIRLDGTVEAGRPLEEVGAHCKGRNAHSIGICYIGGLDGQGHPADTRTDAQIRAMRELVLRLRSFYPVGEVIGHRDTSPDCNGNGMIEPREYIKACPCFDVGAWLRSGMGAWLLLILLAGCGCHRSLSANKEERKLEATHSQTDASSVRQNTLEETGETVEESIEQTVWQFDMDTVTGRKTLSQVSRTLTGRVKKRAALKQEKLDSVQKRVVADSVRVAEQMEKSRTQATDVGTTWGWKWIVPILIVMVLFYYVSSKRKSSS